MYLIVSEVLYNIHLNVKKLNCEFKLMCSQYIHATYISMNYSMFIPDYSSLALLYISVDTKGNITDCL